MSSEVKTWIRAYADGIIDEEQLRSLEIELQGNFDARRIYLCELNLIAALEDFAISAGEGKKEIDFDALVNRKAIAGVSIRRPWWVISMVSACALLLFGMVWSALDDDSIVTISDLSGAVQWTGRNGLVHQALTIGQELPGGTLVLQSANSWVTICYHDGTELALSGDSELTFAELGQKELYLRHGDLSAKVADQKHRAPMLVHTAAAELTVLGTQFNLQVENLTSHVTVNEGLVALTRVSDGKEIRIPAASQVVAEIGGRSELTVRALGPAAATWRSDLRADVTHGKWISEFWLFGQQLKLDVAAGVLTEAAAIDTYKNAVSLSDEGSIWSDASGIGQLIVLSAATSSHAPIVLQSQSSFRIRCQSNTASNITFGISVKYPEGGFAGKYQAVINNSQLDTSAGPFAIDVSVESFKPLKSIAAPSVPFGLELMDVWCVTDDPQNKLEISNVELFSNHQL